MSHPYQDYEPKWVEEKFSKASYRSIFKWGDPDFIKKPKESLYKLLKETFGLDDSFFKEYKEDLGFDEVKYDIPTNLSQNQIAAFVDILGSDYVRTDDYARLSVAYGKTMYDILRLRNKIIENIPDAVLYPSSKAEIEKIVAYCVKEKIPLYVYGGGSSVTRGVECVKGGVSLDMRLRFNKVISFNEVDQTITVQAGMSGPRLEEILNNAQTELGAKRAYTCGHFPQSFEYSSVGGWVVTRGAGQNSTYYGCISDIVVAQEYATPIGTIRTDRYPRKATGPDIGQIMMGSEGAFGVLTHVTLKVFRHMPETVKRFSFMFRDWETAQAAAREIMQSEAGHPSVFRLSDPEETQIMLRLYGVDETPLRHLFSMRGFKEGEMCLFLGFTNGEKGFSKNCAKVAKHTARKFGGMSLTGYVTKSWEKGRFNDPYLRDTIQDFGIVTDTMECTVNWSNMAQVHKDVRAYCKSRPNTICMTHMSHVYPQGANLYFIFIAKMSDPAEYKAYHAGILDAIQKAGASMSHHHGIGKMFAPWLEGFLGRNEYDIIRTLKHHFDPDNIMNPGGTLGLDLEEKDKKFLRSDIK
ncbi:FAD-binding oxidoreductase [Paludicola sp. MB14-C6]|uniref:FAD-binding oxidoreductase n=1 Tax=Paludihabitans sp. MB14-C6 TaxID=3070656 RepID=UPI0027DBD3AD|nr:FAD-binding oxidoreductase [Paludicola sp. MB14-C6]WMJ22861.1 FAD-binding oxidoreductase [Paludicola sp. MB14-C6]